MWYGKGRGRKMIQWFGDFCIGVLLGVMIGYVLFSKQLKTILEDEKDGERTNL